MTTENELTNYRFSCSWKDLRQNLTGERDGKCFFDVFVLNF